MKKKLALIILLSFINCQYALFAAPAVRFNETGASEVYDDKDLNTNSQQENLTIIEQEQEVVITPVVQKTAVEKQTIQELEEESDYLKYQGAPSSQTSLAPVQSKDNKETSKIKKVAGKAMEGVATCVIGTGTALGSVIASLRNNSHDDEEDEQEYYCTKCKKHHKINLNQH